MQITGSRPRPHQVTFSILDLQVILEGDYSGPWGSTNAFSISINQLTSFNQHLHYSGANDVSSFSEQYLEELAGNNADTLSALSDYPFGSSLAFRTYLVDKVTDEFGNLLGYQSLVSLGTGVIQENDEISKGGLYELSIAFANNKQDKIYLGGSINFPLSVYKNNRTYLETDATNNPDNDFNYFEFKDEFSSTAIGVNARLGIIYKPQQQVRLGFALHTPSLMFYNDDYRSFLTTDTEGYAGVVSESSDNLLNAPQSVEYTSLTPYKLVASAAIVLNEAADTRQQKGFVTADVEYVHYRGSRYFASGNYLDESATYYFDQLNAINKDYLKGNINVKAGGELKFNTLMVRLGGAFYGSPYGDSQLSANQLMVAGGLGYRNRGIFADITYARIAKKDVHFPYRLSDKANTYASLQNNQNKLLVTVGFKL